MDPNHNFLLTRQQQELLYAALNANRQGASAAASAAGTTAPPHHPVHGVTMSPTNMNASAMPKTADPTGDLANSHSFLDYDYSFDADTSLDFADQSNFLDGFADGDDLTGDDTKTDSAPSNAEIESPDKRSHPDDEDDEVIESKRRESTDKVPKKPGRKPLTSEPSSKRKAQNRAAQRAFRERKEKHLKDLETKVSELEKASEAAHSENTLLRAQVEKMSVELSEYKKRMSVIAKSRTNSSSGGHRVFGNPIFNNINDVNFQFEFPKFGSLPGPAPSHASNAAASPATSVTASYAKSLRSLDSTPAIDLPGLASATATMVSSPSESTSAPKKTPTSVFSPPAPSITMSTASTTPVASATPAAPATISTTRPSIEAALTNSPSSSTHSHTAPSSSCGTSPEPYTQSPPIPKPVDTLKTIGEEHPTMFAHTATPANPDSSHDPSQLGAVDFSDMSWINGQTNFRFDPQLFGDYRESQENVLSGGGFDDSFFNDALEADFTTPFNTALSPIVQPKAGNLIAQIDAAKDDEFASSSIPPVQPNKPKLSLKMNAGQYLTCNKIWERLQNCPKVQSGDFDLDGLCSDLQKKARCSGSGAVVDEKDFKSVMEKYLDKHHKDGSTTCSRDLLADVAKATA